MTDTIEPVELDEDEKQQIARGGRQGHGRGVDLVGPGGVLTGLTKQVLETALEEELTEHLGYDKHDPAGRNAPGTAERHPSKTLLTEVGPVSVDVPRDRAGTFAPVIVPKGKRRLRASRTSCCR